MFVLPVFAVPCIFISVVIGQVYLHLQYKSLPVKLEFYAYHHFRAVRNTSRSMRNFLLDHWLDQLLCMLNYILFSRCLKHFTYAGCTSNIWPKQQREIQETSIANLRAEFECPSLVHKTEHMSAEPLSSNLRPPRRDIFENTAKCDWIAMKLNQFVHWWYLQILYGRYRFASLPGVWDPFLV